MLLPRFGSELETIALGTILHMVLFVEAQAHLLASVDDLIFGLFFTM